MFRKAGRSGTPDGGTHSADCVGLRPELAEEMAQDCLRHICLFAGKPFTTAGTDIAKKLIDAIAKTYKKPENLPVNYQVNDPTPQAAGL